MCEVQLSQKTLWPIWWSIRPIFLGSSPTSVLFSSYVFLANLTNLLSCNSGKTQLCWIFWKIVKSSGLELIIHMQSRSIDISSKLRLCPFLPNYYSAKISQKLNGNEEDLHSKLYYVDPPEAYVNNIFGRIDFLLFLYHCIVLQNILLSPLTLSSKFFENKRITCFGLSEYHL